MNGLVVSFDDVRERVKSVLAATEIPAEAGDIHLVRDLFGRVRLCAPDCVEDASHIGERLKRLAARLHEALGPHGFPPEEGVLFMSAAMLETFKGARSPIDDVDRAYWVERLLTGSGWWTVAGDPRPQGGARRFTLFSVKGGVGRSTTAAVLAWHLARHGERVLVVDLDLESPGLSSAMLGESEKPEFGVVDWFVEDLVGQGGQVIADMAARPAWSRGSWQRDFRGKVHVVPAHGREPGEYLAKLGRAWMESRDAPWTARLQRLLADLEARFEPDSVVIESRSGLHDVAAATVTGIDADVLLFATDSQSSWTDYDILFRHWRDGGMAEKIRERLWMVSALTPETGREPYLAQFRERAWTLFQERLYDAMEGVEEERGDEFSFDLSDESAPHDPMTIEWNRGLAAGTSLHDLEEVPVNQAYAGFLERFDRRFGTGDARR